MERKRSNLLTMLAAAGISLGAAGAAADAQAFEHALQRNTAEAMEEFLRLHPDSQFAPQALEQLASRFKEPGERGRPDIFGPPGPPEIGPPGLYGG